MERKKNVVTLITILLIFVQGLISAIFIKTNNIREESRASKIGTPQLSFVNIWEPNGTSVSIVDGDQKAHQITSDGAGGAIITWVDDKGGLNESIYAQRIDSNGNILWTPNGIAICTTVGIQRKPQITSDGVGGAIITWYGSPSFDIYAQRIDSNGNILWTPDGTAICKAKESQWDPQIISDGTGGAIIAWWDWRNGQFDIYAQRIDSNGNIKWIPNGTAISTLPVYQREPQLISDGAEGAIITWWNDFNVNDDIYAQRIDSNGITQWTPNGTAICTAGSTQKEPQITSDGAGGAIITWFDWRKQVDSDIYAQRIDFNGVIKWNDNGTAICTADRDQNRPQIISDGAGGAIITWKDEVFGFYDISAQRVDSNGFIQWDPNGTAICNTTYKQYDPQITSDGVGGAIITWWDERIISTLDIYAQRIDFNGVTKWNNNGTAICTANNNQYFPKIINDGVGGAIIVWEDLRNGVDLDIYAQHIRSSFPSSNHPDPITTFKNGSETINWTLFDDFVGGYYRVIANNTFGNYYIWINWTPWIKDTLINVSINRSSPGGYNYTIEYYNNHNQYGNPDTVVVNIMDEFPISNHPERITTFANGSETINWVLYDDYGGGQYRIIANNSIGNYYIWIDWTPWDNNTPINIPIDRTKPGIFNYTIEFYDDHYNFGILNSVVVVITDGIPTSNNPEAIIISLYSSGTINWVLYDDYGGGQYRIIANNSIGNYYIWIDWTPWDNNTPINIPANRTKPGMFNYTIEFYDDHNNFGIPHTVLVEIRHPEQPQTYQPSIPGYNIYLLYGIFFISFAITLQKKYLKKAIKRERNIRR